jgi:hypothetical protein
VTMGLTTIPAPKMRTFCIAKCFFEDLGGFDIYKM